MIANRKYIIMILLMLGSLSSGSEIYQSIRVNDVSFSTLAILHETGIALDHVSGLKGQYIDLVAREDQVKMLQEIGIPLTILIENLGRYVVDRSIREPGREFQLGSMLGNYTYYEAVQRMDSLVAQYPELIAPKISIGVSIQGWNVWAFKVSDNPLLNENEPEVLFTGLTHAREPLGMMNLFYFVQYLCENQETDEVANFLIHNREMWFVPIVNPDGYIYNEFIWSNTNEAGFQRKNLRDTGCGTGTQRGVDLNRNFSYDWGLDDYGSSPDPCSETFRGDSAFSESETVALRDFILNHSFNNVLHYHAFGNLLIHSFGDGSLPPEPDLTTLQEIGADMTIINGYTVGTGMQTVGYPVNGDAVDWSYGSAGLLSYTPEVGLPTDYFWPSEDRVIALCQDQIHQNTVFALVAGSDPLLSTYFLSEENPGANDILKISLVIRNSGLSPTNGFINIELIPHDPVLSILSLSDSSLVLNSRGIDTVDAFIALAANCPIDLETGIQVTVQDSLSFLHTSTINILTGLPNYLNGDLVMDGQLDIFDVLELANILIAGEFLSDFQQAMADLNEDQSVNIYDLLLLTDIIMEF